MRPPSSKQDGSGQHRGKRATPPDDVWRGLQQQATNRRAERRGDAEGQSVERQVAADLWIDAGPVEGPNRRVIDRTSRDQEPAPSVAIFWGYRPPRVARLRVVLQERTSADE